MIKKILFPLLAVLAFLNSCSNPPKENIRIGVDESWDFLSAPDKETSINGFILDLFKEIGKETNYEFTLVNSSPLFIKDDLQKKAVDVVLSPERPNKYIESEYTFSDSFLSTGPVLVIRPDGPSLNNLDGKEIAIPKGDFDPLVILEKKPGVLIRYYNSVPEALAKIVTKTLDGALINNIDAKKFTTGLYNTKLKIASQALTPDGLRLITIPSNKNFIQDFDQALKKLKNNGIYEKLLEKWGLE